MTLRKLILLCLSFLLFVGPTWAALNPWKVLGLQAVRTRAEIQSRYRELAKEFHPDLNSSPEAGARFAEINEAYHELLKRFEPAPQRTSSRPVTHIGPYPTGLKRGPIAFDFYEETEQLERLIEELESSLRVGNWDLARQTLTLIGALELDRNEYALIAFLRSFETGKELSPAQVEFLLPYMQEPSSYIHLLHGYWESTRFSGRIYHPGLMERAEAKSLRPLVSSAFKMVNTDPSQTEAVRLSGFLYEHLIENPKIFAEFGTAEELTQLSPRTWPSLVSNLARFSASHPDQKEKLEVLFYLLKKIEKVSFIHVLPLVALWESGDWNDDELRTLFSYSKPILGGDMTILRQAFKDDKLLALLRLFFQGRPQQDLANLLEEARGNYFNRDSVPLLEHLHQSCEGALRGSQLEFDIPTDQLRLPL